MKLKISCIQSDIISQEPDANRRHLNALIDSIKDSDLIILPETFTTGFPADPNIFAEKENGDTINWLREKTEEKQCVVCGTLITSAEKSFHNTLIWMNPDGTFRQYHKGHAFSMGGEKEISRGKELITIELKGWKIRPLVCYDLRFPVWARNRFINGQFDYDLLIYTANWPEWKSHVWNTLLAARAIENQAFVVGVNRIGIDHNEIPYKGETKILDAKGKVIAQAKDNQEEIIEAILDKDVLEEYRNHFTVAEDWDDFKRVGE